MKTNPFLIVSLSNHLRFPRLLALVAAIWLAGSADESLAAGTADNPTIRYNGTDFEGRQNFQLQWDASGGGTYLVQSADDLSASNGWQTVDSVTTSSNGPVKWMAPEVLQSQRFYRLILPQARISSVEPAVVAPGVPVDFYVAGQTFPTNAELHINGVPQKGTLYLSATTLVQPAFTPDVAGNYQFDLVISGQVVSSFTVVCADPLANPELALQGPPELPLASPNAAWLSKKGYDYYQASSHLSVASIGGDDCDDNDPTFMAALMKAKEKANRTKCADNSRGFGVEPFSGEVQGCDVDLAIPGRSLDFIWARTYHSRLGRSGAATNGWTFSYDLNIQPLGGDILIHNGTGRADTFKPDTNGVYTCPEFFCEGVISNNTFTLTFANTGRWVFNPFDGAPAAGKLAQIVDRNGNIVSLGYDTSGRLTEVVDDLRRTNTVAYDSGAHLQSITDFSGRTVTYAYYQLGETGGSPGDLKSVTSPPVTGTPNGNDFPDGKTTTYTYSSGFTNELENHLLLSVADAGGRPIRGFVYQHNQTDLEFLRCVSIQRGTNTPATVSYLPQTPSPTNQFAVLRCVMNDPEGDVTECFYDARNRCVTERDFTGRATPGVAVTDVDNRPAGKLRSADPDYFETRWTWNEDSLCTSVTLPDGNSGAMIYQRAFNQNSSRSNKLHDGDLRVVHEYAAVGQAVDLDGDGSADTTERVWRFEYDPRFGSDPTAKPGKKLYVGNLPFTDSAAANMRSRVNDLEQTLRNFGLQAPARAISPSTGPGSFDPIKWQSLASGKDIGLHVSDVSGQSVRERILELENVLKNLGLLARTSGNVGINEPLPYANLHASAKGKRFGIGDSSPENPLGKSDSKGWDGTIKGCFTGGDCDDNDPKRHHPTAVCLPGAFATTMQDPRGNVSAASYDASGNRLHVSRPENDPLDCTYDSYGQLTAITNAPDANGHRRVDVFSYYATGPQAGQLQAIAIDEPGVHISSSFEYDARGNMTRCGDPRGHDWLCTYNALDQCVRCETPTNLAARCATDFFYDANNNLVQTSTEVRDATDILAGTRVHIRGYDRLHRLTRVAFAVDATRSMTNDFAYDGNDQCVQVRGGDAVSGADPHQTMSYEYDERGLLFHEIAAAGSSLAATNEYDYNGNGNTARINKIESITIKQTVISYDGFGRPASFTDPMGNQTVCFYDANDNLKSVRLFGETNDVPGSAGNLRLAESRYDYDALDRCVVRHDLHFNPATQAPVGDGEDSTSFAYALNGECTARANDLGQVTTFGYDTASRLNSVTSPNARTTFSVLLDPNGNGTNCTETDLSDLGGDPQVFSRSYGYDSLNRCVSTADNVDNTMTFAYDSLGRVAVLFNPREYKRTFTYDLLGRCTQSVGDLDGDGVPDLADDIVQTSTWSSSSDRLLATTDSHTNTTSYAYDTLGNCTLISCADGTQCSLIWSPRSNLIQQTDANGSVISNSYDLNERCIHRDIAARTDAGVAATTTFETFAYDGCSRLTGHHDDDCDGYLAYDSLGDCTRETLNYLATSSTYDALGNRLSLASLGGRTLGYSYDTFNRCSTITDSGKALVTYAYDGPDRVSRINYDNGMVARVFYDGDSVRPNVTGDYGWKQISRVAHGLNGGSLIADSTYEYDADQNKIFRSVTIPSGSSRTNELAFHYDLANRLTEALVTDNSALTRDTVYNLDRMGNRTNIVSAACSGDYTLDGSALGPLDFQMNQYTATPCDSRTYDDNGNLVTRSTASGGLACQYDYADRLVEVQAVDTSSGTATLVPVASYRYDALGRRISKAVYAGGTTNVTQFGYAGGRVIEERLNGAVSISYLVDDRYLLGLRSSGNDYYLHCDDQGNVLALTGANGAVVERYEYDDYGAVTFLAPDGTPSGATASSYGNAHLFGGLCYDAETGLDGDDGGGYLDPESGRFLARTGSSVPGGNLGLDSHQLQARTGEYTGVVRNNPWSGGHGLSGFGSSEKTRDPLHIKFQDGDIPTGSDSVVPRPVLKGYFESGDRPTSSQF